jgi:hypothetical protein
MPLPPLPQYSLSRVYVPIATHMNLADVVEVKGHGIDPTSDAGGYAVETLERPTTDAFRSNSTRLMHAMYGSIPGYKYPLIHGTVDEQEDLDAAIGPAQER